MLNPKTRVDLGRSRILVVEDNPQAMAILAQILLGFGVNQPCKCASLEEAVSVLGKSSVDLILADDDAITDCGLRMTEHVRSDPEAPNYTAHVVLLSGSTSSDRVCRARDVGASFMIAKPVTPGVLLERIEWVATNHRPFVTADG